MRRADMKVGDLIRVKPHVRLRMYLDFEGGDIGLVVKIMDAETLFKALVGDQVYIFRKSEIEVYESR